MIAVLQASVFVPHSTHKESSHMEEKMPFNMATIQALCCGYGTAGFKSSVKNRTRISWKRGGVPIGLYSNLLSWLQSIAIENTFYRDVQCTFQISYSKFESRANRSKCPPWSAVRGPAHQGAHPCCDALRSAELYLPISKCFGKMSFSSHFSQV